MSDGPFTIKNDPVIPLDFAWVLESEDDGVRASLLVDGEILFRGPLNPNHQAAHTQSLEIFLSAMSHTLLHHAPDLAVYEDFDPQEGDESLEEYINNMVWVAGWMMDLKVGDTFRLQGRDGNYIYGVASQIRETDASNPDHTYGFQGGGEMSPIYCIYDCIQHVGCEGHHMVMPKMTPCWIGNSIPGENGE